MTKAPLCVGHVRLYQDAFERFTRGFAPDFQSLAQETVDTHPVIKSCCRTALWTFRRILDSIRDGIGRLGWFVHQAAAASAAHKWRISSSTSAGSETV